MIGAAAMAAHAVARGTQDLDILVLDPACLSLDTWQSLTAHGVTVDVRRGDEHDPLRGVVRLVGKTRTGADALLDVIVGRSAWQADILERATPLAIEGATVPVASSADVILLKLFAGGPQDLWDIQQLLEAGDRASLEAEVQTSLAVLPPESRALWASLVRPR